ITIIDVERCVAGPTVQHPPYRARIRAGRRGPCSAVRCIRDAAPGIAIEVIGSTAATGSARWTVANEGPVEPITKSIHQYVCICARILRDPKAKSKLGQIPERVITNL